MRFKCLFTKEIFKDEGSFIAPVNIKDPVVIKAIELYNEDCRYNYADEPTTDLNEALIDINTLEFDEWVGVSGEMLCYIQSAQQKMVEEFTANILHDLNNITAVMKPRS